MGYIVELRPELGAALVVGGGLVAARKVQGLTAAGFRVTVVAPEASEAIRNEPLVTLWERRFEPGDIAGHVMVVACTGDREVNALAGRLARRAGIPVIVADRQEEGTASTPATHRDGRLTIAVSTGGGAPALARAIRDELVQNLGPGAGDRVEQAADARASRQPD